MADIFPVAERGPEQLRALYDTWQHRKHQREHAAPSLVFAVVGQGRWSHFDPG